MSRSINDVRGIFEERRPSQSVLDAEKQITELFSDIHVHARMPSTDGTNSFTDEEGSRKTSPSYDKNRNLQNIERHLSMKKTIRKKMTRDLQNAFVDYPELQDLPKKDPSQEMTLLDMLRFQNEETTKRNDESEKRPGFWKKLTMRKGKRK
ncbi:uncharacterized protein LOC136039478 isoform X3 [Artemia franciscana]|nr:hypothetical protein QYM36_007297 [Artemia franciscana]KAK2717109.1 hypothetical protein QYM36_007297 [Artemia franciscana]KAK2717111.1 hypothetical protein QYM36_007297 [Artemia franciscana]